MKRNIALLLAGVLITSAVPKTVSAQQLCDYTMSATESRAVSKISSNLTKSPIPAQPKTLFVSPKSQNKENAGSLTNNEYVENWVRGGYLEVLVPEKFIEKEDVKIVLQLKNAEWFFDSNNLGEVKLFDESEGTFDKKENLFKSKDGKFELQMSKVDLDKAILILKSENNKSTNSEINEILGSIKEKIGVRGSKNSKDLYGILEILKNSDELKTESQEKDETPTNLLPEEENKSNLLENLLDEDEIATKEEAKKEIEAIENSADNILAEIDKVGEIKNDTKLPDIKEKLQAVVNSINSDDAKSLSKKSIKELDGIFTKGSNKELFDSLKGITGLGNDASNANNIINQSKKLKEMVDNIKDKQQDQSSNEILYEIPIIARTLKEGENSSILLSNSNGAPIESENKVFAIGTKEGLTTTTVSKPVTARTRFKIDSIAIKENRISTLKKDGSFIIAAPSGYEFVNLGSITLDVEGGLGKDKDKFSKTVEYVYQDKDNPIRSAILVNYKDLIKSSSLTGTLVLQNIELLSTNNDNVIEKDLYMAIKNNKDNIITPQVFLAAYARDWKINLTAVGTVPTLVNGKLESIEKDNINDEVHKAVTVKFEEQVPNTWWGERTTKFELPEGVKIRKALFTKITNLSNSSKEALNGIFYNDKESRNSYVRIDDNVLTLYGLTSSKEAKASFELNLWLNIEPGFTGNVDLKLKGSSLNTDKDISENSIVIAKAVNPINVKAELTDVKVGYEYVTVGDFTITETAAGRLKTNEDVYISIVSNNSSTMIVDPSFKYEVTNGDIKIRNMDTTNTQLQLGNTFNNKVNGANIIFRIDRASQKPSSIKFSNIKVKLNDKFSVSSKEKFDIVVWGPAIANNYKGLIPNEKYRDPKYDNSNKINTNDYFYKPGIIAPYINAETNNSKGIFKNVVKVKVGNPVILVNDKEVAMPTAAYVSTTSNSTMVPVRFIATALGLDESKIVWDEATGTVTINTENRIVQMTAGKDVIKINGTELPMLSPDGLKVSVEIKDDRAFIPFRALGEAFGISVGWNAETSTATYNAQTISNLLPNTIK